MNTDIYPDFHIVFKGRMKRYSDKQGLLLDEYNKKLDALNAEFKEAMLKEIHSHVFTLKNQKEVIHLKDIFNEKSIFSKNGFSIVYYKPTKSVKLEIEQPKFYSTPLKNYPFTYDQLILIASYLNIYMADKTY